MLRTKPSTSTFRQARCFGRELKLWKNFLLSVWHLKISRPKKDRTTGRLLTPLNGVFYLPRSPKTWTITNSSRRPKLIPSTSAAKIFGNISPRATATTMNFNGSSRKEKLFRSTCSTRWLCATLPCPRSSMKLFDSKLKTCSEKISTSRTSELKRRNSPAKVKTATWHSTKFIKAFRGWRNSTKRLAKKFVSWKFQRKSSWLCRVKLSSIGSKKFYSTGAKFDWFPICTCRRPIWNAC